MNRSSKWIFSAFLSVSGLIPNLWGGTGTDSAQASVASSPTQDKRSESPAGVTTLEVRTEYGTLAFRGHVERKDLGDSYEFRPRIDITFRPAEFRNGYIVTNRTPFADLRWCSLVATIYRQGDKRAQVLYRERLPITILLVKDGETKPLPDLKFRLAKVVSDEATHVGLSVSDGNLLWPIQRELK